MTPKSAETNIVAEQDGLWLVLDQFLRSFTSQDWHRAHGKHWKYADVPYHLAAINHVVADAITRGADGGGDELATLEQLDAWNEAQLADRPAGQSADESLAQLRASQEAVRQAVFAIGEDNLNAPVWLPMLRVRGWRTLKTVLEYNFWHHWLHFMEAHLRHDGSLPDLPASWMNRALDFYMDYIAGQMNVEKAAGIRFTWVLELTGTGGGVWTFTIANDACRAWAGRVPGADVAMTTDVGTYLKTLAFGLQNPTMAMTMGIIRVQGLTKVGQLQTLFTPTPDQVIPPTERGLIKDL
jgi:hypothetical protein